jgi:small-conductance mechanosensitive channel
MENIFDFLRNHRIIIEVSITAVVLVFTFVFIKLLPRLERLIREQITRRTKTDLDDKVLPVIIKMGRRLIWLAGIYFALLSLKSIFTESLKSVRDGILYVLVVITVAQLLSRILQLMLDWYSQKWGKKVRGRIQDEFGPLFKRLIVIFVYLSAVVVILHRFNQNVSSIVVSLGVGSLAIALAAKDTLANMIAGFMIMTDRPFRVGDRIQLESGEKGDVHDIGLRSTKILTFDNTLIVVPNHQIINEKVTNLSYPDPQIRVSINVGVAYGTDLVKAKKILEEICTANSDVLESPPPKAYFISFGDSSLDLKVVCRVAKWGKQWGVSEELRMEINRVFEEEGIEIPFPQSVVHLEKGES